MTGLLIANLVVSTLILAAGTAAGVTLYCKQRNARNKARCIGQGIAAAFTQAAKVKQQAATQPETPS